jgi:hypothetical protein
MASYSKSVKSYVDVHQAFEAAGETGGILLSFDTPQRATVWAQRANAYRVLLRKQNEAAGRDHACEFDHLMVRRPKETAQVLIEPRGFNFVATTLEGAPVTFSKKTLSGSVPTPYEVTSGEEDLESFFEGLEKDKKK